MVQLLFLFYLMNSVLKLCAGVKENEKKKKKKKQQQKRNSNKFTFETRLRK